MVTYCCFSSVQLLLVQLFKKKLSNAVTFYSDVQCNLLFKKKKLTNYSVNSKTTPNKAFL